MRHPEEEIRHELADLGAYRAEIEAERDELAKSFNRILDEGRHLDRKLDGIARSAAEWSVRAGGAGIPEREVIELLGLPRPAEAARGEPGDQ